MLCHEEGRDAILGLEDYPLPSLDEAIYLNLELARRTNPRVRCAGVSLNTSGLAASRARAVLAERKAQLGMPVADPMRSGPELEELVASCLSQPLASVTLQVNVEKWPLKAPFRITGYTFVEIDVVVATISCGGHTGRGEATGVYYRSENAAAMVAQIEAARADIESGIDREALRRLMPAGGARNAVDCALWDLESRLSGMPAWKIAGLNPPVPLVTTFTLGAEDPEQMARTATLVRRRAGHQAQTHRHSRSMPSAYAPCGQHARMRGSESTPTRASRALRSPT